MKRILIIISVVVFSAYADAQDYGANTGVDGFTDVGAAMTRATRIWCQDMNDTDKTAACDPVDIFGLMEAGDIPDISATYRTLEPQRVGGLYAEYPVAEDFDEIYTQGYAFNVTRVYCSTDTGTANINIENASGTDILSADLVCDAASGGGQDSCASGCDVNTVQAAQDDMAAYALGNISITSVASSPTILRVHIYGTPDN